MSPVDVSHPHIYCCIHIFVDEFVSALRQQTRSLCTSFSLTVLLCSLKNDPELDLIAKCLFAAVKQQKLDQSKIIFIILTSLISHSSAASCQSTFLALIYSHFSWHCQESVTTWPVPLTYCLSVCSTSAPNSDTSCWFTVLRESDGDVDGGGDHSCWPLTS